MLLQLSKTDHKFCNSVFLGLLSVEEGMLTIDIAAASKVDLITKNNRSVQIIAIIIILLSSLSYTHHYFIIIIVYLIVDIIITFFASLRSSKPQMP